MIIYKILYRSVSLINIIQNITPNNDNLYPDIVIEISKDRIIIDIIIPFDEIRKIEHSH